MPPRYSVGEQPAIRQQADDRGHIDGHPCPFCGSKTLLQSRGDLASDTERVEVYCNNTLCDAREVIILIRRGERTDERADVQALTTVDRGTESEQERDGYTLRRDATGRLIERSLDTHAFLRPMSRGSAPRPWSTDVGGRPTSGSGRAEAILGGGTLHGATGVLSCPMRPHVHAFAGSRSRSTTLSIQGRDIEFSLFLCGFARPVGSGP